MAVVQTYDKAQQTWPGADVERDVLLRAAYRSLGSWTDAEDVVQECSVRWYRQSVQQRSVVESPAAWHVAVTRRISVDAHRVARRRNEVPLDDDACPVVAGDLADAMAIDELVTVALVGVLRALTRAESSCFILHDLCAVSFADISQLVDRSVGACRQLASIGRRKLRPPPSRGSVGRAEWRNAQALRLALSEGDSAAILAAVNAATPTAIPALRPVPDRKVSPRAPRDSPVLLVTASMRTVTADGGTGT